MVTVLENPKINTSYFNEAESFIKKLNTFLSKKELINCLLEMLVRFTGATFGSFVEKENNTLKVISQIGESTVVKNTLNKEMCFQIFNWVTSKRKIATLKIALQDQFLFIPLVHEAGEIRIYNGIFVLYINSNNSCSFEISNELSSLINVINKVVTLTLTTLTQKEKYSRNENEEEINSESAIISKLQSSISGLSGSKKIFISTIRSEHSLQNGSFYWVNDFIEDMTLILICQINFVKLGKFAKSIISSFLTGYVLGEINSLKSTAEIFLKPKEVLSYLNKQLNLVFKQTGISMNAWYGIFNVSSKKVSFANANYPDPFLIGLEQQVINLTSEVTPKAPSLGVSMSSKFSETSTNIYEGCKLIICNQGLIDNICKIGQKFDRAWLVQILETLGSLSLSEFKNNLESLLSENTSGTAHEECRLALLLEIPS